MDDVSLQLKKLEMLGTLSRSIARSCDCSFLLWSRGLLPLFLAELRTTWRDPHQLHLLMAAVADAGAVVQHAVSVTGGQGGKGEGGSGGYDALCKYVLDTLEWEVLRPLCQVMS